MTGLFKGIQQVISVLQSILNGFKTGILFISGLAKSMLELVRLMSTTLLNTNTLIGTLPSYLVAFATLTIGVTILYIIIGRNTGK